MLVGSGFEANGCNSGFHAIVSADVVDTIQKWGGEYITVEEDQRVSITN